MRSFRLQSSYYACLCGGTFYVDLKAPSYNIAPCTYKYVCGGCGKVKFMTSEEETRFCADFNNKKESYGKFGS